MLQRMLLKNMFGLKTAMNKHIIIPIFIPHVGCPHDCIFCNQAKITGQIREDYDKITGHYVERTIDTYLETIDRSHTTVEVSFFGGTFTAIDLGKQKELLGAAYVAKMKGKVDKIRLSTRPDYISLPILDHLAHFSVDIVELGIQSMDEEVLRQSKRSYPLECVRLASTLIKKYKMTLGHQLMLGLPGDTKEKDLWSLEESLKMNPDLLRIYPALVLRDTEMADLYMKGEYVPYSLDEAVEIAASMMRRCQEEGVLVIRAGLQATEEISQGGEILDGPFHPAFRELCESYLLMQKIMKEPEESLEITIGHRDLSKLYADKKKYFHQIIMKKTVKVTVVEGKLMDTIIIGPNKKECDTCI